jgi:hypothetical protein
MEQQKLWIRWRRITQAYMYIYLLTRRASMPVIFLAMHDMAFKQGIFDMKLK